MSQSLSPDGFRSRFFSQQLAQPFGKGLFADMVLAMDQVRKAEVLLRIQPQGVDPRPRSKRLTAEVLKGIRHPHLVTPLEDFVVTAIPGDPTSRAMEVLVFLPNQGLPLDAVLGKNPGVQDRARIVEGMLNGLEALHAQRWIHGNLKPSNVLVQVLPQAHALLSDFGYSEPFDFRESILAWPSKQLGYLAPEQLKGEAVQPNVDFWSLGMLAYEIFTGKYLFGNLSTNGTEVVARIQAGDFPMDISGLPMRYQRLVRACLVRDPLKRPAKVSQLRDLMDGKIKWVDGKAVLVEAPVAPPQVQHCPQCRHQNPKDAAECSHCGSPLRGPTSLRRFRSSRALAIWTLVWFGMFMLPIGFFYYGLYRVESTMDEHQDVWDKVKEVIEWYDIVVPEPFERSYDSGDLSPEEKVAAGIAILFGIYFTVFGSLWLLFQMLWTWRVSNNLAALGAFGRKYHPALMLLGVGAFLLGILLLFVNPIPSLILIPTATIIPLLMLQEVWRGSNPTYLAMDGGWKRGKGSFVILSWWLLSLVFPLLLLLPLLPVGLINEVGLSWKISLEWFSVTVGILIGYCVLYGLMIVRVGYRQERKYRGLLRV
jgi:serine/threonine protein kinase